MLRVPERAATGMGQNVRLVRVGGREPGATAQYRNSGRGWNRHLGRGRTSYFTRIMKTFKFFAFLIITLTASVVLAALKISQYPNTASPAPGDYFILEDAGGTTNHNVRWGQICLLLANVTNSTITNLNVWEGYMSNLFVTNLYADNFDAPNLVSSNFTSVTNINNYSFTTNQYVYQTNIVNYQITTNQTTIETNTINYLITTNVTVIQTNNVNYLVTTNVTVLQTNIVNYQITTNLTVLETNIVNELITTNLTVNNNQYVSNSYTTNLTVNKLTINTNVTYELGANNTYTVATNDTTTNVVVNFTNSVQTIRFTNNVTLFSTTNRPAYDTNLSMTLLVFPNTSGGNLVVNTNPALGWHVDGTAFPVTVTNGDRQTFTLTAWGPYESNVLIGSKWFH